MVFVYLCQWCLSRCCLSWCRGLQRISRQLLPPMKLCVLKTSLLPSYNLWNVNWLRSKYGFYLNVGCCVETTVVPHPNHLSPRHDTYIFCQCSWIKLKYHMWGTYSSHKQSFRNYSSGIEYTCMYTYKCRIKRHSYYLYIQHYNILQLTR